MANCLCLAIGRPYPGDDSSSLDDSLEVADKIFVVCFAIEMTLKIISLGFWWCGPTSYLKDGWNILDFCIVMVGIMSW
jgi:voltage-dependent calcium channel L type alpha-1D